MKILAISKTFFRFETDEEDEASGKLDERLNKAMDEVKSVLERHGFEYIPGYTTRY